MATVLSNIADNIQESDTDLNIIIQDYLNDRFYFGSPTTVAQWRLDNYSQLRIWAYPDITEYNDAQVKINSDIPAMESEGAAQLADYIETCLDVKTKFPKE